MPALSIPLFRKQRPTGFPLLGEGMNEAARFQAALCSPHHRSWISTSLRRRSSGKGISSSHSAFRAWFSRGCSPERG